MTFGGFEVGRTYNCRGHIHVRFGGQRQGGICTPKDHPVVIAFTGASDREHGNADGWGAEMACIAISARANPAT
jgi:5-methylcytosine-specific restriction enzyme A